MATYGLLMGKIFGMLATGFALNLTNDKRQKFQLHQECDHLWHEINRKQLYHVLRRLKLNGLVKTIKQTNNTERVLLSEKGKKRWIEYQFHNLKIRKTKRWNGKWRIVLFDIPEPQKKIRDALRRRLKNLGFLEFQKSVLIYPFPCENEINFIINFFNIEDYVYYLEAPISPDYNFRQHFNLN